MHKEPNTLGWEMFMCFMWLWMTLDLFFHNCVANLLEFWLSQCLSENTNKTEETTNLRTYLCWIKRQSIIRSNKNTQTRSTRTDGFLDLLFSLPKKKNSQQEGTAHVRIIPELCKFQSKIPGVRVRVALGWGNCLMFFFFFLMFFWCLGFWCISDNG